MTTEAPVVKCANCSDPGVPASTTTCKLARHDPSFNSRNENPLESRRVRSQPLTVTASLDWVGVKMCFISVRIGKVARVVAFEAFNLAPNLGERLTTLAREKLW